MTEKLQLKLKATGQVCPRFLSRNFELLVINTLPILIAYFCYPKQLENNQKLPDALKRMDTHTLGSIRSPL